MTSSGAESWGINVTRQFSSVLYKIEAPRIFGRVAHDLKVMESVAFL